MKKIVVIVGCMASGKDTIYKRIAAETNVKTIISTTSRPMRVGEVEGVEYEFITEKEALDKLIAGEFIEHRTYNTVSGRWIYGIEKNKIDFEDDSVYLVIIDFNGLEQMKGYLEVLGYENSVVSIYIDAESNTRIKRAIAREKDMSIKQLNEVYRRNTDDLVFVEPAKDYCDYVFTNETIEDLEKNVKEIKKIIKGL